jgi:uncharacterized protein DUF3300
VRRCPRAVRAIALLGALLVLAPGWPAEALQAPPPPPSDVTAQEAAPQEVAAEATPLTPQQLDDLVAAIALYPDPLVAQILAASTYPVEVVEADRWVQANPGLQGTALTDAAQNQPWDPSVQALVVFPSVLAMLDHNLTWTINLGNAFLAQEQDVMDAIQRQRQRAMTSGALVSNPQQLVQQTTDAGQTAVEIVPAQPDVIYVPVYDPVVIWGPPLFHPWPVFWYPPRPIGAIVVGGFLGFFLTIVVARSFHHWGGWNRWGWGVGWHSHRVVVHNSFYVRNNYRPPRNQIHSGPSPWSHDPGHRGGVAYPSRGVAARVGAPAARISQPAPRPGGEGMVITRPPRVGRQPAPGARPSPAPGGATPQPAPAAPAPRPAPGGPAPRPAPGGGSAPRPAPGAPAPRPAPGAPAPRPTFTPPTGPGRDHTLFGGSSASGDRARIESDRGHGSLGNRPVLRSSPAPQSRPSPTPQGRPAPAPQGRPAPGRTPSHR